MSEGDASPVARGPCVVQGAKVHVVLQGCEQECLKQEPRSETAIDPALRCRPAPVESSRTHSTPPPMAPAVRIAGSSGSKAKPK